MIEDDEIVNLGGLIARFYQEYLALYEDEELASVAAAATVNEILIDQKNRPTEFEVA